MRFRSICFAVYICAAVWAPSAAAELTAGVPETVDRIKATLERQGFTIDLVVDHAAAADSVDLDLRPTQVVFFSNRIGDKLLIRRGQSVALDLPLRFLVFEDEGGEVHIDTNDVGFLIDRHGLATLDPRVRFLGKVLGQFGSADSGIITVESTRSFDDTLAALEATLVARGFRIPLVKDFALRGWKRRAHLRPTTVVLFGNPNVGTPLMQSSQSIGLDLPQKMLVFEDADGSVRLAYNDPFFLADKHDVVDQDARLGNIANALRNIAETAADIAR